MHHLTRAQVFLFFFLKKFFFFKFSLCILTDHGAMFSKDTIIQAFSVCEAYAHYLHTVSLNRSTPTAEQASG